MGREGCASLCVLSLLTYQWAAYNNYRVNEGDRYAKMPVITPSYPCMNSTHNVMDSTLALMVSTNMDVGKEGDVNKESYIDSFRDKERSSEEERERERNALHTYVIKNRCCGHVLFSNVLRR